MAKILITGVSGLVGKALYKRLSKQHEVIGLARKKSNTASQKVFTWDYVKREVEKEALENIDAVVHLAGAGVMDKRWTDAYKKEIIESRKYNWSQIISGFEKKNDELFNFRNNILYDV
jgi:NAD dependent epimerase/dehydratase family enzyme